MVTTASNSDIVKWQIKWLTEIHEQLSEGDMDWLIKMDDAFKRQNGILTPKQLTIVEDMYKKYP